MRLFFLNIIRFFFWKFFNFRKLYQRKLYLKKEYGNLSNKKIFSKIYSEKIWNKKSLLDYDSGPGSHDIKVVNPYVKQVVDFLKINKNLIVIDLGCGDFNVGRQYFKYAKKYIAVDVVESLIKRNKTLYSSKNLSFKSLDAVHEDIPNGDCIIIKEVFQHITNHDIKAILKKIINFKFLLITESEPLYKFKPNIDKLKGPDCRTDLKSGIVIDQPPFNFKYQEKKELIRIKREDRYLTTTLYMI